MVLYLTEPEAVVQVIDRSDPLLQIIETDTSSEERVEHMSPSSSLIFSSIACLTYGIT